MVSDAKCKNTGFGKLRRSKTRAPKPLLKEISKGFCLRVDTLGGTSQLILIDAPGSPPGTFASGSPFFDLIFRSRQNPPKGTKWFQKCSQGLQNASKMEAKGNPGGRQNMSSSPTGLKSADLYETHFFTMIREGLAFSKVIDFSWIVLQHC